MMPLEGHQGQLNLLQDIYEISTLCSTRTYIWAGMVRDILAGHFLCSHGDVDAFTLDLWNHQGQMAALFTARGYTVSVVPEVEFLKVEQGDVMALFNQLELDGEIALWRHAGLEGTVYFPRQWLSETPIRFYDTEVWISGLEFEYAIKTHPELLNPLWNGRPKDSATIQWLTEELAEKQIAPETILRQIWSYTPYWVKYGYPEYTRPVAACQPQFR